MAKPSKSLWLSSLFTAINCSLVKAHCFDPFAETQDPEMHRLGMTYRHLWQMRGPWLGVVLAKGWLQAWDSKPATSPHGGHRVAGSLGNLGTVLKVIMGEAEAVLYGAVKGMACSRHKTHGILRSGVCFFHLCFQTKHCMMKTGLHLLRAEQRCLTHFHLDPLYLNFIIYMAP